MEGFIQGALGGIVPAAILIIVYFISFAGRWARMENDICWLKKYIERCLPPSKDHSQ